MQIRNQTLTLEDLFIKNKGILTFDENETKIIADYCHQNPDQLKKCLDELYLIYINIYSPGSISPPDTINCPEEVQVRLNFFINMVLDFYPPKSMYIDKKIEDYTDAMRSLAIYWYNEGPKLLHPDSKHPSLTARTQVNLIALQLFFMSGNSFSVEEKSCYVQIIEEELKVQLGLGKHIAKFDLEDLARQSPQVFIDLYRYLFAPKYHDYFKVNPASPFEQWRYSLFELYGSFAYQALKKDWLSGNLLKAAKKDLLDCQRDLPMFTNPILEKHFGQDLDVLIALGIFHSGIRNDLNQKIYDQFLKADQKQLDLVIEKSLDLFGLWMTQSDPSWDPRLTQFAIATTHSYANKGNLVAREKLKSWASKNKDCAIACFDFLNNDEGYDLLLKHAYSGDATVYYLLFKFESERYSFPPFDLLVSAAEKGLDIAREHLLSILEKDPLPSLRYALQAEMSLRDSAYSFQLLKKHFPSTFKIEIAHYAMKHNDQETIDRICEIIAANPLAKEEEVKLIEDILKYTHNATSRSMLFESLFESLKKIAPGYFHVLKTPIVELLMAYAENDIEVAIILSTSFLKGNFDYHHQKKLAEIIKSRYSNTENPELKYFLYKNTENPPIDLLQAACHSYYVPAVMELCKIFEETAFYSDKMTYFGQKLARFGAEPILLPTLIDVASFEGPEQYRANEILIKRHFNVFEYQKAERYVEVCFKLNPEKAKGYATLFCFSILQDSDDPVKRSKATQQLIDIYETNDNPYVLNELISYSQKDIQLIIFLSKYLLEEKNNHLVTEKQKLERTITDHDYQYDHPETSYFLFKVGQKYTPYLYDACAFFYGPAILECCSFVNNLNSLENTDFFFCNVKMTSSEALSDLLNILTRIASHVGPEQYEVNETLARYYLRQHDYQKAEPYFKVCSDLDTERLNNSDLMKKFKKMEDSSPRKKTFEKKLNLFREADHNARAPQVEEKKDLKTESGAAPK